MNFQAFTKNYKIQKVFLEKKDKVHNTGRNTGQFFSPVPAEIMIRDQSSPVLDMIPVMYRDRYSTTCASRANISSATPQSSLVSVGTASTYDRYCPCKSLDPFAPIQTETANRYHGPVLYPVNVQLLSTVPHHLIPVTTLHRYYVRYLAQTSIPCHHVPVPTRNHPTIPWPQPSRSPNWPASWTTDHMIRNRPPHRTMHLVVGYNEVKFSFFILFNYSKPVLQFKLIRYRINIIFNFALSWINLLNLYDLWLMHFKYFG